VTTDGHTPAPDAADDRGHDASEHAAALLDVPAGRLARWQTTARIRANAATGWATRLRARSPIVDAGFVIYERDRVAAGTVLGSAIAFRLFLFFIPFVVFCVGLVGIVSGGLDAASIAEAGSVRGSIAENLQSAQDQSTAAKILTMLTGLFLMASAGRSLGKALVASSGLAWSASGKVTVRVRALAAITGVVSSLILVAFAINRIRDELGVAVAGISFGAGFFVYLVLIVLLMASLPRATTDPGAILPGAALVAVVIVGMQALSQLYIPGRLSGASELYGGIGVTVVALGWLFILGRTLSLAFSVNAALFERFGSLTQAIFSLPVLRLLPARWSWFRSYFELDESGRTVPPVRESPDA